MSVSNSSKIIEASKQLEQNEVIGVGTFRLAASGSTSNSLKCVISKQFWVHHDLESGDEMKCWIDSKTGALIMLPGDE